VVRLPDEEVEAYCKPALDALGNDDPAEAQVGEVEHWRGLLESAGAHARTRPAPGEWSITECLGHMVDSELVNSVRYRMILAEQEPAPLNSWDEKAWSARFDHSRDDPAVLLQILGALRRVNIALWRGTSAQDHARTGMHAERGPQSFEFLFRMQAGHGRIHRAQAEQALAAVRRARMLGLPLAPDRED
jgi:hypothetical protein